MDEQTRARIKPERNDVRVGVRYDDREGKRFPFGIQWVEVGGERIKGFVSHVSCHYGTSEFSDVTITLTGATFEEVDVDANREEQS